MNRTPVTYLLTLVLLILLPACAKPVMQPDDWQDPALVAVWPEPPQPTRISLQRVVGSLDDLKGDAATGSLLGWLLGETGERLPLVTPYAIAADGAGRVWVGDPGSGVVHRFDLAAREIAHIVGFNDVRLASPAGLAVDVERNRLYVADSILARIFVYDLDGRPLETFAPGFSFGRPAGLALDRAGRLYVADALNGVVEVFAADGAHSRTVHSAAGEGGQFLRPSNVAVDAEGRILITDSMKFRVEVQSADGELLNLIGGIGDKPGSLARPRGVAFDSQGHIYIADAAFDNIQIFDLAGNLLLYFGGPGKKPGQFCLPAGIFIDRNNRGYVAESCNGRFQLFRYHPLPD